MRRVFSTRAVAIALDVSPKWLDNVLSHHDIDGVSGGRQGVDRELAPQAVRALYFLRVLAFELGLPVRAAVSPASRLAETGYVELPGHVILTAELDQVDHIVQERMLMAVESAPRARRGRPRATP